MEEGLRFIRKRADDVRRKRGPPYDLLNIDVIDAGDPWGSATWRFLGKSALSASKKALTPQGLAGVHNCSGFSGRSTVEAVPEGGDADG